MKKIILISHLLLFAFSLKAQVIFKTVVPSAPVIIGKSFQVQYVIEDAEKVSDFKPGAFRNFRIAAGPDLYTGSVTIKNEEKQVKNLVFTLAALKPGRFIIQGATAIVNGTPVHSNDAIVEIISKDEAAKRFNKEMQTINSEYFLRPGEDAYEKIRKNLFLKLAVNKKNCYVGEPVLVTFKLYSRLESKSDIIKNPGFYGFTVYDMINLADKEMTTEYVQGKLFDVHTIRKVQLYPLQEGIFTIDPMEVKNSVEFSHSAVNKKTEQEIVEGMLRKDSNEMQDADAEIFESNIATEPVSVVVKSAPVKSKPSAFNGATGMFNITASVISDKLAKNEEGVLDITTSGKGNFIQLNAPAIEWPGGIEGFEPTVKDILDKTQSPLSGSRTFRYSFVSAKPGAYTIPSVSFSFFNPDSGKYKTITTVPIVVKISNEEKINKPNLTVNKTNNNGEKKYWLIGGTALLLCLAAGYLFFLKIKNKPETKPIETTGPVKTLHINEILPVALLSESIMGRDFYDSLHQFIWKFFNYYFNLSGSEMNKKNLSDKLNESKVNKNLIDETLQTLQQCEAGMFTNADLINNKEEVIQKIRVLLEKINALLSSSNGH